MLFVPSIFFWMNFYIRCWAYRALWQPTSLGRVSLVYFRQTLARRRCWKLRWSSEHIGKERRQGYRQRTIVARFTCYGRLRCVSSLFGAFVYLHSSLPLAIALEVRGIFNFERGGRRSQFGRACQRKVGEAASSSSKGWTGGSSSLISYGNTWVSSFFLLPAILLEAYHLCYRAICECVTTFIYLPLFI